jgi:hypothetical protein
MRDGQLQPLQGPVGWGCRVPRAHEINTSAARSAHPSRRALHLPRWYRPAPSRPSCCGPRGLDGAAWSVGNLVGSTAAVAITPILSTTHSGWLIRSDGTNDHQKPAGFFSTERTVSMGQPTAAAAWQRRAGQPTPAWSITHTRATAHETGIMSRIAHSRRGTNSLSISWHRYVPHSSRPGQEARSLVQSFGINACIVLRLLHSD